MKNKNFYIAALLMPSGTPEDLEVFFSKIPPNTNAAFVVVSQLPTDTAAAIWEQMSRVTAMPVAIAAENQEAEAGHIYILPPGEVLRLEQYRFEKPKDSSLSALRTDLLFNSMGLSLHEKAIAVLFEFDYRDGRPGLKTIANEGGLILAQQAKAELTATPGNSLSEEDIQWAVSPSEIAERLLAYLENPEMVTRHFVKIDLTKDKAAFDAILERVSNFSQTNFSNYKVNTLVRQIEKRMQANHIANIEQYRDFTRSRPQEVSVLYNNFLIGVTCFFRDVEAFKVLEEKVIPELYQKRRDFDGLRIWVAGCCTGEEAYSIAMLLEEYMQKSNERFEYKIFATDLDHKSIETASLGRYSGDIHLTVPEPLRQKHFTRVGDFYEIKKNIRKRVIFVKHEIVKDPPFIRMDLISCRNVFIYLKSEAQKKLLWTFNYALKPDGFLMLGANETSDGVENLFEKVSTRWKVFKNKATNTHYRPHFGNINYNFAESMQLPVQGRHSGIAEPNRQDENYSELLAAEYAPACAFVNQQNEVVYTHGSIERYLHIPRKKVSFNIFNMIDEKLGSVFRGALRKVSQENHSVVHTHVTMENKQEVIEVNLRFKSMPVAEKHQKLILIEFSETTQQEALKNPVREFPKESINQREIDNLEQELKVVKRELQFTVDELETINGELQASHEEMISANEELQSTNEELQSSNEELQMMNVELKNKIDEVTSLDNDINNLTTNTPIATLFLDNDSGIRRFTPLAKEHFNIMESDTGRPIMHLTHHLDYPDLYTDIQSVLQKLIPAEKEIRNLQTNRYYLIRILPYKTEEMRILGVVITLIDVSELRETNNRLMLMTESLRKRTVELEISSYNWSSLVNNMPDMVWRIDKDMRYTFVNKTVEQQMQMDQTQIVGKMPDGIGLPQSLSKHWKEHIQMVFDRLEPVSCAFEHEFQGGQKYFLCKLIPEFADDLNTVKSVLKVDIDITEIKEAEAELQKKNYELQSINESLDHFVYMMAHDLRSPVLHLKFATQLLREPQNPEQVQEYTEAIRQSVHMLERTLEELIKLVKIKNADQEAEKIRFESVWQEVSRELGEPIRESGAVITTGFVNAPTVSYIHAYLLSMLRNLLSNAIKYRDPERELRISISSKRKKDEVVLSVEDNGQGMDMERVKDKLFKPFQRFSSGNSGVGLGLYTIKYLVEKNFGRIEVSSTPGEGSIFSIFLKEWK